MKTKEEKICSFTQNGTRLQLTKIIQYKYFVSDGNEHGRNIITGEDQKLEPGKEYREVLNLKYQVKLNRKIVHSSISEYNERKVFATYCQNIVLQLKIY